MLAYCACAVGCVCVSACGIHVTSIEVLSTKYTKLDSDHMKWHGPETRVETQWQIATAGDVWFFYVYKSSGKAKDETWCDWRAIGENINGKGTNHWKEEKIDIEVKGSQRSHKRSQEAQEHLQKEPDVFKDTKLALELYCQGPPTDDSSAAATAMNTERTRTSRNKTLLKCGVKKKWVGAITRMHGAKDVSCVMSIVVNCNSITQHVPRVTGNSRELQAIPGSYRPSCPKQNPKQMDFSEPNPSEPKSGSVTPENGL